MAMANRLKPLLCSGWVIVGVAFFLRISLVLATHAYRFRSDAPHFSFAWEMGNVAGSVAAGHGFASPCGVPSGPTAMVTPGFPLLLAGIFRVFGPYSEPSRFVLLFLNCIFSALTCLLLLWIGKRTFGETTSVIGAWLWALWPMALWETHRVWETSISAFLFSAVFLSVLELRSRRGLAFGMASSLLWGLAVLVNPAILAFLLPALLWQVYVDWRAQKGFSRALITAAIGLVVAISPWLVRNYVVFHRSMMIRDNFGYELYLGNHPQQADNPVFADHVCSKASELAEFRASGELAFIEARKQQAIALITRDPEHYVHRVAARLFETWVGTSAIWLDVDQSTPARSSLARPLQAAGHVLFAGSSILALIGLYQALRRKLPGAVFFLFMVLLPPIPYYLTHTANRFRHPIEPVLMLLVALPLAIRSE